MRQEISKEEVFVYINENGIDGILEILEECCEYLESLEENEEEESIKDQLTKVIENIDEAYDKLFEVNKDIEDENEE